MGIVPNEQCTMVGAKGEDGAMSTTVGARDKHTEVLAVEAGDMVLWELRVAERGVDLCASLQLENGEQVEQVRSPLQSDLRFRPRVSTTLHSPLHSRGCIRPPVASFRSVHP